MTTPDTRTPAPATVITVTGAGNATITPVDRGDGPPTVQVQMCIVLPADPDRAALRLTALASHLQALIGPARPPTGRAG